MFRLGRPLDHTLKVTSHGEAAQNLKKSTGWVGYALCTAPKARGVRHRRPTMRKAPECRYPVGIAVGTARIRVMPAYRILTVCTGNICRSPAAAVVLRKAIADAGLADQVVVSSAGTSWEAEGAPMDERTEKALIAEGYEPPFEHTASAIHHSQIFEWDLVLAMTAAQAQTLRRMATSGGDRVPPQIIVWRQFDPAADVNAREEEIPVEDPWFRGKKAFARMVRTLEGSVGGIVLHVRRELAARATAPAGG